MFKRYFLVSFLIHSFIISFVWIGFSAPGANRRNSFAYLGGAQTQQASSKNVLYENIMLKEPSPAFFEPWIKMRDLSKPN